MVSGCDCLPCDYVFASEFQRIRHDLCVLSHVSGENGLDVNVKTSILDPQTGYLADKVEYVSGITITEQPYITGNKMRFALDLSVLDARYENQGLATMSFDLHGGTHNGHATFRRIFGGIQSLVWPDNKSAYSSFSGRIPRDFAPGDTSLAVRWTKLDAVSGAASFNVQFQGVEAGDFLSLPSPIVTLTPADGTIGKVYETIVAVTGITLVEGDQFLLNIGRDGTDALGADVHVIGISLSYTEG